MGQVFLSYPREDISKVRILRNKLQEYGFDVWMDEEEILGGQKWNPRIINGIQNSTHFVACLSSHSLKDKKFQNIEINFAVQLHKNKQRPCVIPLLLEECNIPNKLFQFMYIDLNKEDGFENLCIALLCDFETSQPDSHSLAVLNRQPDVDNRTPNQLAADISASISTSKRPQPEQAPPRYLFFSLEIVDETGSRSLDSTKFHHLRIGQHYHLRVTTMEDDRRRQGRVAISDAIKNYELCPILLQGNTTYNITNEPNCETPRDSLYDLTTDFEVIVPPNCRIEEAEIALLLVPTAAQQGHQPQVVATLSVYLEGMPHIEELSPLEKLHIAVDQRTPDDVAFLHVEEAASSKMRLEGWHVHTSLPSHTFAQPSIELKASMDSIEDYLDLKGSVTNFSKALELEQLRDWLKKLYIKHDEQLCMIIVDHADSNLPWEMVEFEPGKHLGSQAMVSRWLPVGTLSDSGPRNLVIRDIRYTGQVIAHIDPTVPEQEAERDVLNRVSPQYCNGLDDLRESLSASLSETGLVYLRYPNVDTSVEPRSQPREHATLKRIANVMGSIIKQAASRPLFFVNTCESARIMGTYNDLPKAMLAHIANGYIGTLGPVNSVDATQLAVKLFDTKLTGGIQPADLLRQLRKSASQEIAASGQVSLEAWRWFLCTFMYVYYGSPLARLDLDPARKSEA